MILDFADPTVIASARVAFRSRGRSEHDAYHIQKDEYGEWEMAANNSCPFCHGETTEEAAGYASFRASLGDQSERGAKSSKKEDTSESNS